MKSKNFTLPFDVFVSVKEPHEVKPALEKFQQGKTPSSQVAELLDYWNTNNLQIGNESPEKLMRQLVQTQTLAITPELLPTAKEEITDYLEKGVLDFRGSGYWGLEFSTPTFRWFYLSLPLNEFVLYNLFLMEDWNQDPPYPITLEQCCDYIDNRFMLIKRG